MEKQNEAVI